MPSAQGGGWQWSNENEMPEGSVGRAGRQLPRQNPTHNRLHPSTRGQTNIDVMSHNVRQLCHKIDAEISRSVQEWRKNASISLNTSNLSRYSGALVRSQFPCRWVPRPCAGTPRPEQPRGTQFIRRGNALARHRVCCSCSSAASIAFLILNASCYSCADPVPQFVSSEETFPVSYKTFLYNISSKWTNPRLTSMKTKITFFARRRDEAQAVVQDHSVCSLTTSSLFLSLSFNCLHVICIV